jgi:hypothetical protein
MGSGNRDSSIDGNFYLLFSNNSIVHVFQIPRFPVLDDDQKFLCKWVSLDTPCILRYVHEYAVFRLPETMILDEQSRTVKVDNFEEKNDCV